MLISLSKAFRTVVKRVQSNRLWPANQIFGSYSARLFSVDPNKLPKQLVQDYRKKNLTLNEWLKIQGEATPNLSLPQQLKLAKFSFELFFDHRFYATNLGAWHKYFSQQYKFIEEAIKENFNESSLYLLRGMAMLPFPLPSSFVIATLNLLETEGRTLQGPSFVYAGIILSNFRNVNDKPLNERIKKAHELITKRLYENKKNISKYCISLYLLSAGTFPQNIYAEFRTISEKKIMELIMVPNDFEQIISSSLTTSSELFKKYIFSLTAANLLLFNTFKQYQVIENLCAKVFCNKFLNSCNQENRKLILQYRENFYNCLMNVIKRNEWKEDRGGIYHQFLNLLSYGNQTMYEIIMTQYFLIGIILVQKTNIETWELIE